MSLCHDFPYLPSPLNRIRNITASHVTAKGIIGYVSSDFVQTLLKIGAYRHAEFGYEAYSSYLCSDSRESRKEHQRNRKEHHENRKHSRIRTSG